MRWAESAPSMLVGRPTWMSRFSYGTCSRWRAWRSASAWADGGSASESPSLARYLWTVTPRASRARCASACRAEDAIAGVPQPGADVAVLVELAIEGGGPDRHVGMDV